ncbi:hypothetical protein, partial [Prevotella sp.]|uniref:hypothetical protein n=1 Tax=Prevotella sp. TaxID=59823 RepID=UPI0030775AA5
AGSTSTLSANGLMFIILMILIVYILIVMNLAAFAVAVRLAYSQKRAKICLPHFLLSVASCKKWKNDIYGSKI